MKRCSTCKEVKGLGDFYKNKALKDGLDCYCKKCKSSYNKSVSEEIKATKRLVARTWNKENPEKLKSFVRASRAKRLSAYSEPYSESEVIKTYGTCCHICNIEIDFEAPRRPGSEKWELSLHIDHLIPLSKGGEDTLENVRPSHAKCNLKKSATMPAK